MRKTGGKLPREYFLAQINLFLGNVFFIRTNMTAQEILIDENGNTQSEKK